MVEELTEEAFDRATAGGLVVVDFWAPWCMPCRMVAPAVEELAKEYAGKVRFFKLNIDEQQGPAARHKVMGIPTLLLFKDGKVEDRIVGALPKEKIKARIDGRL